MRESTWLFVTSLGFLVLLTVPTSILAIECWTCTSGWDPKCDPFEPKSIRRLDCDHVATGRDKPTLCKKVRGFDMVDKSWYTVRGCGDSGHRHDAEPGCKTSRNSLSGNEETTCYCDDDFCNGSVQLTMSNWISIVTLMIGTGAVLMVDVLL